MINDMNFRKLLLFFITCIRSDIFDEPSGENPKNCYILPSTTALAAAELEKEREIATELELADSKRRAEAEAAEAALSSEFGVPPNI